MLLLLAQNILNFNASQDNRNVQLVSDPEKQIPSDLLDRNVLATACRTNL